MQNSTNGVLLFQSTSDLVILNVVRGQVVFLDYKTISFLLSTFKVSWRRKKMRPLVLFYSTRMTLDLSHIMAARDSATEEKLIRSSMHIVL